MIRNLVGRVAVVAMVVGMTVVAPLAVAGVAPAASAQSELCGYLNDGSGFGSASSLPPKAMLIAGTPFSQRISGAWQLCYYPALDEITLYAYQGLWCMADDSGNADLRHCNGNADQQWDGPVLSGSFKVHNANGGVLCATGGVMFVDTVVAPSNCSDYHQSWAFEGAT